MNQVILWLHQNIILPEKGKETLKWLNISIQDEAKQKNKPSNTGSSSSSTPVLEQAPHPSPSAVLPSDDPHTTLTSSSTTTGSSASMQQPSSSNLAAAMLKVGQFANTRDLPSSISVKEVQDLLVKQSIAFNLYVLDVAILIGQLSALPPLSLERREAVRKIKQFIDAIPVEQLESLMDTVKKRMSSSTPSLSSYKQ